MTYISGDKQFAGGGRALAEQMPTAYHLDLPHLSDTFVGFSTTPRHIFYPGDAQGSIYLQSLAAYLDKYKDELPFDCIYMMVRQHMAQTRQGKEGIIQGADESNRLLKLLYFTKQHTQVGRLYLVYDGEAHGTEKTRQLGDHTRSRQE